MIEEKYIIEEKLKTEEEIKTKHLKNFEQLMSAQ